MPIKCPEIMIKIIITVGLFFPLRLFLIRF